MHNQLHVPLPNELQARRHPRQSRSRILVESIKQACLKILLEEPNRDLTATRIAEVAGITIGSFYQYFPSTDAVFAAVYENLMQERSALARKWLNQLHKVPTAEQCFSEFVYGILDYYQDVLLLNPGFSSRHFISIEHFNWLGLEESEGQHGLHFIVRKMLTNHCEDQPEDTRASCVSLISGIVRGTLDRIADTTPHLLQENRDGLAQSLLAAIMAAAPPPKLRVY